MEGGVGHGFMQTFRRLTVRKINTIEGVLKMTNIWNSVNLFHVIYIINLPHPSLCSMNLPESKVCAMACCLCVPVWLSGRALC